MGSNPKALIVCFTEGDQLGLIQSVNKAACSLLGYTKTDLIGRHINIL
jgi:PAS domain S-box-containing protein